MWLKNATCRFLETTMTLEDLRKQVLYQNTLEIWIKTCAEKNIEWTDIENYKKFIDFLQTQNLNMKKFPLCVNESDQTLKVNQEKNKFAELLSASQDPNCATYTIKLNDSAISLIRKFNLKN